MARTGLVRHPAFLAHDTGAGHPERADRLRAVLRRLDEAGIGAELAAVEPRRATKDEIGRVHAPGHFERIRSGCARGGALDAGDTVVVPASFEAALLAAGGGLAAVDAVMAGDLDNAFVACRPPGHHAESDTPMGFCLFNNVAIAAAHLRAHHGVERVAILDWDVHHGNGTQHAFEADPSVFFASLHQWPWYPGTGAAGERGRGEGEGTVLNCPMRAGSGDVEYLRRFEGEVLPAIEAFDPGFVLISAGFDAHERDPLSYTEVTTEGFRRMSRLTLDLARDRCAGRVVAFLEGGYDLEALADSVEAHLGEFRAG